MSRQEQMDYKKYIFKDKEYDLSEAVELMQKGKWQKAIRTIEKVTYCSKTEAEHIAVNIKNSLPDGDKIKQKESIGSKFMLLVVIAALAVGGYYAYGHFIKDPQAYSIEEKDPSIKTEFVGTVDEYVWWVDELDPEETHRNAIRLFDLMKNDKGQFFIYREYSGDKFESDEDIFNEDLFRTNKAYFDVATGEYDLQTRLTADYVSPMIGRLVKNYLNSNCTKIIYYGTRVEEDDPDGFNCAADYEKYINNHLFDGKTAQEYFTSKNLDITCNSVKVNKIGVAPLNSKYFATCEAEVTTNTCDGKSIFPKEGKTDTITVDVITTCEQVALSRYQLVVNDIIIR